MVHRSTKLRRRDVTTRLGIRVTTPARTAIDMSPRLNDKALKRTVNKMLGSLWTIENRLAETVARHSKAPGAGRIAKLLGLPGTPTRSGWEDGFPAFCERYGLPAPVMGQPFGGYIRVTEERLDERPRAEADRLHAILEQRRRAAHAAGPAWVRLL